MVNQNFTQNWLPPRVNTCYPDFQGKLWINRIKLTNVISNLDGLSFVSRVAKRASVWWRFFVLDSVCVERSVRSFLCEKGRNGLFVGQVMRREVWGQATFMTKVKRCVKV